MRRTEKAANAKKEREAGNACFKSKKYEVALRFFNAAIEIAASEDDEARKEGALALGNRAMTFIKLERYEEALKDCDECIFAAESNGMFAAKASFRRALCLHKLGRFEEALKMYAQVRSKISKSTTIAKCDKAVEEISMAIDTQKMCREQTKLDSDNVRTKVVKLDFTANDPEGKTRGHPACTSPSSSEKQTPRHDLSSKNKSAILPEKKGEFPRKSSARVGGKAPHPDVQRRTVMRLVGQDKRRGLVENEYRFLVEKRWWDRWTLYTQFEEMAASSSSSPSVETKLAYDPKRFYPGPIENEKLLEIPRDAAAGRKMAFSVARNRKFVILCRETWTALVDWYGGGPAIPRPVVRCRDTEAEASLHVAIYDDEIIPTSRSETGRAGSERRPRNAREVVGNAAGGDISYCASCGANRASQWCGRCRIAHYCSRLCQESHWPFHKNLCRSYVSGSLDRNQVLKCTRGKAGLHNVGNTCFLASVVQCLSHATPLTRHLLGNRHVRDINLDNPLGTGGVVTGEYVSLLKSLWLARRGSHSPLRLLRSVVDRRDEFENSVSQQDAHELLMFLLDAMHEDLNRVKKKEYLEPCEANGRPDDVVANEFWELHLKRNRSVIVDNCNGQFKSNVTCPECCIPSITFDPFACVTLPLPRTAKERSVVVYVKRAAPSCASLVLEKHAVKISNERRIRDLRTELSAQCGVSADRLYLNDVYKGYNYRHLKASNKVSDIADDDVVVAHEFSPPSKGFKHVVLFTLVQSRSGRLAPAGVPALLSIPERETSAFAVFRIAWDSYLRHLIGTKPSGAKVAAFATTSKGEVLHDLEEPAIWWSPNAEEMCNDDAKSRTWEDVFGDTIYAGVLVSNDMASFDAALKTCISTHTSVDVVREALSAARNQRVTLTKCLKLFSEPEILDGRNMWRCPKCKKEVSASKRMQLWKLPDVLMVHFRRFKFRNALYGSKISTAIDFPTEGLDMDPFVLCNRESHGDGGSATMTSEGTHGGKAPPPASTTSNDDGENGDDFVKRYKERRLREMRDSIMSRTGENVYDLFAVVNHFGNMQYGHYTTCARDVVDSPGAVSAAPNRRELGPWYSFDDEIASPLPSGESVVSRNAYILFYSRRPARTEVGSVGS